VASKSPTEIRTEALAVTEPIGCHPRELPLSEVVTLRPPPAARKRCLALFAVVAVAFGLDRQTARHWLERENLYSNCSTEERRFLKHGSDDERDALRGSVEALWALAWALELVPSLSWNELCANDFIELFPDLRVGASSQTFAQPARLRDVNELSVATDAAFLLHHCHVASRLEGRSAPNGVPEYAVWNRRRALEWLTGTEEWDEVSLDT